MKGWRIDHGELGSVRRKRRGIEDEQVAREEVVPGVFVDHPNGETIFRVGAGEAIQDVEPLAGQRTEQIAVKGVEMRRLHRPVDRAPGDVGLARRLAHDELVVRRAAGVLARAASQRTVLGEDRLLPSKRLFVQRGSRQVPFDGSGFDSLALEAKAALNFSTHSGLPRVPHHHSSQKLRIVPSGSIQVNNPRKIQVNNPGKDGVNCKQPFRCGRMPV